MLRYSFDRKKLKKISKKELLIWGLLGLLSIFFVAQLFTPAYEKINHTYDCIIEIDEIDIRHSGPPFSTGHELTIVSDDVTYCVRYSSRHYGEFRQRIDKDLLLGEVALVEAKVSERYATIWDRLQNKKSIVDLKTGSTEYYSIETEREHLRWNRIGTWVVTFLALLCWGVDSLYLAFVHGLLQKRR